MDYTQKDFEAYVLPGIRADKDPAEALKKFLTDNKVKAADGTDLQIEAVVKTETKTQETPAVDIKSIVAEAVKEGLKGFTSARPTPPEAGRIEVVNRWGKPKHFTGPDAEEKAFGFGNFMLAVAGNAKYFFHH